MYRPPQGGHPRRAARLPGAPPRSGRYWAGARWSLSSRASASLLSLLINHQRAAEGLNPRRQQWWIALASSIARGRAASVVPARSSSTPVSYSATSAVSPRRVWFAMLPVLLVLRVTVPACHCRARIAAGARRAQGSEISSRGRQH
jgi:hypothetical protein